MISDKYKINSVDEMFRWKLDNEFLKNYNLTSINYPSVEIANKEYTTIQESVNPSLHWELTDVLYSFTLIYYLGLTTTNELRFNDLLDSEKKASNNNHLCPFSTKFLFKCSLDKGFTTLNTSHELLDFIYNYFSLGNVIPIWPGGNESRGKMGIFDIPELFFNSYPRWTTELLKQNQNAYLDSIISNELFLISRKNESGLTLKGYKNAFQNLNTFKDYLKNNQQFYFDYLIRCNNIIKNRKKLLSDELGL